MNDNIKDKVVVITGASSGLGEAAAKHLTELGAMVILGARRADRIEKLAGEINNNGGKALAMAVDVTQRDQVKRLVDAAVEQFGRVDVILNNAGIMPLSPMDRLNVEDGKPAQFLKAGDVIVTHDGVKHWHGASKDSWFEHIAITAGKPEWMEPVSDEQYNAI